MAATNGTAVPFPHLARARRTRHAFVRWNGRPARPRSARPPRLILARGPSLAYALVPVRPSWGIQPRLPRKVSCHFINLPRCCPNAFAWCSPRSCNMPACPFKMPCPRKPSRRPSRRKGPSLPKTMTTSTPPPLRSGRSSRKCYSKASSAPVRPRWRGWWCSGRPSAKSLPTTPAPIAAPAPSCPCRSSAG